MDDKYSVLTDEQLDLLARGGDRDAEEALLLRYKAMVSSRAEAYFMLGGDSFDLIQEGMIGLLNAIRNYEQGGGAAFSTYARTCVDRRIIDAIKAANRQKHQILNEAVALDAAPEDSEHRTLADTIAAGDDSDPEAQIMLSETVRLLLEEDSTHLSEFERKVLELIIIGYSKDEIAEKTGKSVRSINNAIARIRSKLSPFFQR